MYAVTTIIRSNYSTINYFANLASAEDFRANQKRLGRTVSQVWIAAASI